MTEGQARDSEPKSILYKSIPCKNSKIYVEKMEKIYQNKVYVHLKAVDSLMINFSD